MSIEKQRVYSGCADEFNNPVESRVGAAVRPLQLAVGGMLRIRALDELAVSQRAEDALVQQQE